MSFKKLLSAAFLLAGLISTASAGTINWTLNGLTFNDGGFGSGTFATDSTSGALLSWDITTTAGGIMPGFHYDSSTSFQADNFFFANSFLVQHNTYPFSPYLNLTFANALNTTGVNAKLITGVSSYECTNCSTYREVTGGIASVTAVPEPEAYALMLVGLSLVGTMVRRRKEAYPA